MRKKILAVMVVVMVVGMSFSLFASGLGSIGLVNFASMGDLEAGNEDAYVPGISGELYLSDYLGFSVDAVLLESWPSADVYWMLYMFDAVAKLPFGLLEPYFALGPAYFGVISDGETTLADDSFGFNTRAGLDVNILDWLSVGVEANFFVDDLEYFFNNIGDYFSEEGLENSLIGITAKLKF